MNKLFHSFVVIALICFTACSSPESDGKKAATKVNTCCINYFNALEKCEKQFCDNFDASKFTTRNDAIQEYKTARQQVFLDFEKSMSEAEGFYKEKLLKYSKDYQVKRKLIESFDRTVDVSLKGKVMSSAYDTLLPPSVLSKIRSIIPSKPSPLQIPKDLVGHSLSEGIENGYQPSTWRWNIEDGEISNFNIESVLTDSPDEYILVAKCGLLPKAARPTMQK